MRALEYSLLGGASFPRGFLVRARASSVSVWRFNGLRPDLVVYGHVVAVPKTSFSSAMSLLGVLFQSVSEATGKFSLAFAPVLPCGVVALSSLRQFDDMKLAAFWFSETASSEVVA
ncbi:unnamed protein product [Brassica napus]|uniref:(rape) hypothetical protein n=1 Tax=Brassica napus TaxID=3708 RepID=A0A817BL06_BRANA|nr:unnamed protein product [Brassica napus]